MTRVQETDADWVTTAMSDDSAVADLLTLLRRRRTPPPEKKKNKNGTSLSPPPTPLEWTIKQPRSKANTTRTSPSTPLSWSCSHDSNQLLKMKLNATAEGVVNINKRSKKKKTMAELKEEETLLVIERGHLMKQLETFRFTLENQRAMNESLKRYKIDLQSQPQMERGFLGPFIDSIPNQIQLQNTIFPHSFSSISREDGRYEKCDTYKRLISTMEKCSEKNVLPDLNLPFDEHSSIELL